MDGIALKRMKLDVVVAVYDPSMCIICQQYHSSQPLTSTENGRSCIINASLIRQDEVNERVRTADQSCFVYHMTNDCYKKYTLRKTLDLIEKKRKLTESTENVHTKMETDTSSLEFEDSLRTRSQSTPRAPPTSAGGADIYHTRCVICGFRKHDGDYW